MQSDRVDLRNSPDATDGAIMRAIRNDPKQTREQLRRRCGREDHVALHTIDRYFHTQNMIKWPAKKDPKLTPERAAQRLTWALERKNWRLEDFKNII